MRAQSFTMLKKTNPTQNTQDSKNLQDFQNLAFSNNDIHTNPPSNPYFPRLDSIPQPLQALPKPPKELFYSGNLKLLESKVKIAIVGTRAPNPYTKQFCAMLASEIVKAGGVVVSGGALGVDIIAHRASLPNTIMFSPSSLDIIYPKTNIQIIKQIMQQGLILSEYAQNYQPHKFSFLERNRLVVGLSDIVIIPQADLQSGSMQSARLCIESKKRLFVLPHRLNESLGTQSLLMRNLARAIYEIKDFIIEIFGVQDEKMQDPILEFCKNAPSYEEALARFGLEILEYEMQGKILRENGNVRLC